MAKDKPDIDRIFHALGDPTRRALMERLSDGPMTVSKLAEPMAMSLAAVVQHLQVLEEAGLIETQKAGRVRTCRIDPLGLDAAAGWIGARRARWEQKLDLLGELLEEEQGR